MNTNGHSNGHASGVAGDQLSFEFYQASEQWEQAAAQSKAHGFKHTTLSGNSVKLMYTPEDLKDWNYMEKLGFPGLKN